MSTLDQFFQQASPPLAHPLIAVWQPLLDSGRRQAFCEIKRPRLGISYPEAKLILQIQADINGEATRLEATWDFDLNRWLIDQKVRARDEQNECLRFNLVLAELLRKIEIRLGDGYFSAVLLEVIKKTGLADRTEIREILSGVGNYSPYYGKIYDQSVQAIEGALSQCALWLRDQLGYSQSEAERIFVGAVASYLDDRFSVTNRKILGLV
jgi:hypothetical protein